MAQPLRKPHDEPERLDTDIYALSARRAVPARRTVTITGNPGGQVLRFPRMVEVERRRPAPRALERVGPRPDRIAMYAVIMAAFMIIVAVLTGSPS
jgi:hypothetical protein